METLMQALVLVFEETVLPHLDAAYNLARWLAHNERDAEDVVQEAFLRALRHFSSFKGGDARPWLLAIVRNTYYTWLKHNRLPEEDRKSTRLNSSHGYISYAVFCLKKKKK